MSTRPPYATIHSDAMLHVSLTGSQVAPVTAARDTENAQSENAQGSVESSFNRASRAVSEDRVEQSPPEQLGKLFDIIGAVADAESRPEAIRILTLELSRRFPNATVRCAIGDEQLRRFYDHRLGWLGPESGPRIAVSNQWENLAREKNSVVQEDDSLVITLAQASTARSCIIWVHPVAPKSIFGEWLRAITGTLSSVFWSRPNRTTPKMLRNLTRTTFAVFGMVGLMGLLLAFWPVPYRVNCAASVRAVQQRMVSAPFEATLLEAHVKPGQTVKAGETLVSLDGRPLRIERESVQAEIQQASKEHDTALATGRVAEAQQARLRERQLTRTLELLSDRLGRLEVVSPIDGVVISGELSQYVGSPLELGQTLFEISALDRVAIEIEIPAHEIQYVSADAETKIHFEAVGGRSMNVQLQDIYPAAEIRDDQNVFVGRVEVENAEAKLKPGMQGDATTYGPVRPWIWGWVRGGIERVLWWVGY